MVAHLHVEAVVRRVRVRAAADIGAEAGAVEAVRARAVRAELDLVGLRALRRAVVSRRQLQRRCPRPRIAFGLARRGFESHGKIRYPLSYEFARRLRPPTAWRSLATPAPSSMDCHIGHAGAGVRFTLGDCFPSKRSHAFLLLAVIQFVLVLQWLRLPPLPLKVLPYLPYKHESTSRPCH